MTSNKEKRKDLPPNEKVNLPQYLEKHGMTKRCSQKLGCVCRSGLWIKVL